MKETTRARREATEVPGCIGEGGRRYEMVREISRGGMGTVHLGRLRGPLGFTKPVAIKTMHAHDVADPYIARMFAAEARLTAGLSHANIVSTIDVLVENGSVFIVMEYIDGSSLADLLGAATELGALLPVEVSCAIMHDVLLGLDHAHDAAVIHCDISPQNILVGRDGLARVLDFGIAKAATSARDDDADLDDTEVRGKLPYMAPEQLRGAKIDHRVDVYAAGATLWEMLTGTRLFRGTQRAQLLTSVLTAGVDPPSKHRDEVPRILDAVVLDAVARDPRRRFGSARDMANALEAAVPLASREDVVAALRHFDPSKTPASGVRALSAEEIAVRDHARALRATLRPSPAAAFVAANDVDDAKRTSPSLRRRATAAASSLRVRLATVGLLGIALGAGQATFHVLPLGAWLDRLLPKTHVTPPPPQKDVPSAWIVPPVATPPPAPVAPLESARPRTEKTRKPRR